MKTELMFFIISLTISSITVYQFDFFNDINFKKFYEKSEIQRIFLIFGLIFIIPIASLFSIYLCYYKNNFLIFNIFSILLLLIQILLIITLKDKFRYTFKSIMYHLVSFFIPLLISIYHYPIYFYREYEKKIFTTESKINVDELEYNLSKINNKVKFLENNINSQTNEIKNISDEIELQLNKKKEELKNAEIEKQNLNSEILYYKKLSRLSKEDAEIVLETIKKNQNSKLYEYLIGFILGIVGSLSSSFIFNKLQAYNFLNKNG